MTKEKQLPRFLFQATSHLPNLSQYLRRAGTTGRRKKYRDREHQQTVLTQPQPAVHEQRSGEKDVTDASFWKRRK